MHIEDLTAMLCAGIKKLPLAEQVEALNRVRAALHEVSPFKSEPVDSVQWVASAQVVANEYNPNRVARPEMELLYLSIKEDGITMPVVAMPASETGEHLIVDGFHRNDTIQKRRDIAARTHGYTPISLLDKNLSERIAATIRHNRARGRHGVEPMAAIVGSLTEQGLDNSAIAKQLGMEPEEVLRLKQVGGIAVALANQQYDRAWEVRS